MKYEQNNTISQLSQKESIGKLQSITGRISETNQNNNNLLNEIKQAVENDIIQEIRKIDRITLEFVRNEKAALLTEIDIVSVFDNFTGREYYAYNAPLQYELEQRRDRLKFHVMRYRNEQFEMAYYYYPIFAYSDTDRDIAREWMRGIRDFYQMLDRNYQLTDNQKQKITFYVPTRNYRFSTDSNITYFIGDKSQGEEAIIYIHNSVFMDLQGRRPRAMLITQHQKIIELLRNHRTDTTKNMRRIIGIEKFLEYLDGEINS